MRAPSEHGPLDFIDYEPDFEIRNYLYTIIRHYKLVILFVFISTSLMALKLHAKKDTYTSVAQILIQNQGITIGRNNQYYRNPNYIDSHMIHLWMFSSPVMKKINKLIGNVEGGPGEFDITFPIRQQREGSRQLLVTIAGHAGTPEYAFKMVDSMIRAFRSQLMDNQLQQTRESLSWMAERLADQKKKVEEAEARFQEYKRKIGIISFENQSQAEAQKLLSANSELNQLINERLQLEVELKKLKDARSESQSFSDLVYRSQGIESVINLLDEIKALQAKKQEKLQIFKSKHPQIRELDSRLKTLRRRVEAEKDNTITALSIKIQTIKDRESILKKSIQTNKTHANEVSQKEWQYRILERDVKTNSELYNSLLSELEGTDLRGKIESTTVTVIEPPRQPFAPDPKRILRNLLLAAFVGLFLGTIFAVILEHFESSLRSPEEIERRLGVSVVGMIPEKE